MSDDIPADAISSLHDRIPTVLPPFFVPPVSARQKIVASSARIVLVHAPAGQGKSVLLADVVRQALPQQKSVWLDLQGIDIDAETFRRRLAKALEVDDFSSETLQISIADYAQPLHLVIDNYPSSASPSLDRCLDTFLAQPNSHIRWLISCRHRPACRWSRYLLNGCLLELDGQDLTIAPSAIEQMLNNKGLDFNQADVSMLFRLTAGWPAGVCLLLHDLKESRQLKELSIDPISFPHLFAYFDQEIVPELSSEELAGLRILASLNCFNLSMADELLAKADLAEKGLTLILKPCFISPLTGEHDWFCVNPLISRLLMANTQQTIKNAWQLEAIDWLLEHQYGLKALEQSLLAGQPGAAEIAVAMLPQELLLSESYISTCLRWFAHMPTKRISSSPATIISIALALIQVGRTDEASELYAALAHFLPQPSADLQRQLLAQWGALEGLVQQSRAQRHASVPLEDALHNLPLKLWGLRLLVMSALIRLYLARHQLADAQELCHQALQLARMHNSHVAEMRIELDHALILEWRGEYHSAMRMARQVLSALADTSADLKAQWLIRLGRLLIRTGDFKLANETITSGLECFSREQHPAAFHAHIALSELAESRGEVNQAFVHLQTAERLMHQLNAFKFTHRGIVVLHSARLWVAQDHLKRASSALERVYRYHGGDMGLLPPAQYPWFADVIDVQVWRTRGLQREPVEACQALTRIQRAAEERGQLPLAAESLAAQLAIMAKHDLDQQSAQKTADFESLCLRLDYQQLAIAHRRFLRNQAGVMEDQETAEVVHLSTREREVLKLIAKGLSNSEVSNQLFISLHTVKTHLRRIYGKLGVYRRTQAVAKAASLDWMAGDES